MKKIGIVLFLLVLSSSLFAFEYICDADVPVWPDEPPSEYCFWSVNFNDVTEVLLLGYYLHIYRTGHPLNYDGYLYEDDFIPNNTKISSAIKSKMKQFGANACLSTAHGDYMEVNLLLPNGTYTTVFYVPGELYNE